MRNLIFFVVFFVTGFMVSKVLSEDKKKNPGTPPVPSEIHPDEIPPPSPLGKPLDKPLDMKSSELTEKMWHEEEASFIFRLNEKITLTLNKEVIARTIVKAVYDFLNAEACVLYLLDESSQRLDMEFGLVQEREIHEESALTAGQSISGIVLKNKDPLIINNLENYSYYKSLNKEGYLRNAILSVPMLVKGECVGVISLCNKDNGKPYTRKDLDFLVNVSRVGGIAFENIRLLERIQESYLKTMTTLAMVIDARDHYTKRHSENVTKYSLMIAKAAGLSPEQTDIIKRAALLHDIGKIGIRDDVLLKTTRLTPEDFSRIKTHPVIGDEIVKSLPFLKDVATLVRHHHERYDGKGYPDGIAGSAIEFGARILAVADSFDAMTTDRPYRKRLSLEEARTELVNNKSTQFDPAIVDKFLKIIENNPALADQT
ncbi:MAG: HD domain-containing protein [Candidatus Omnitrophica bacterium]|nr:HD domain-containing protein [Candidatus Omnitrophota bacterium]